MADERPKDIEPSAHVERPRRAAPTLELDAVETSDKALNPDKDTNADRLEPERRPITGVMSAAIISTIFGGSAAALVIAAAWWTGWPAPRAASAPASSAGVTVNTAAIDALAVRVTNAEAKMNAPLVPSADPGSAARLGAVEKSIESMRAELAASRTQSDQFTAALNEIKTAPRETAVPPAAPPPDLSPINDRLAQLDASIKATAAEIARPKTPPPANDVPARRAVAAALLDLSVRQGEPYATALAATKPLAPSAEALKPLEPFAASGVPSANAISRELLAIIEKLPRAAADNGTTGSFIDRLQAGASRLVHVERTDAPAGNSHDAVFARAAAAARRNDVTEARRELSTLLPPDRSVVQPWIDKADARDAAFAASHQLAADMMAALNKPAP